MQKDILVLHMPGGLPGRTKRFRVAPTEFVELHSRGRFYNEDHPLHGKPVIEIKQMTTKPDKRTLIGDYHTLIY